MQTNLLRTPTYSTREFHCYDAKTKTFIAEASDLADNHFRMGQAFNDSCDEGITLVSSRTGREMPFMLNHTIEKDGEVQGWEFIPCTRADQKTGLKVTIFND